MKSLASNSQSPQISSEELQRCTEILELIAGDSLLLRNLSKENRERLLKAAGQVNKPHIDEIRRRIRAVRRGRKNERRNRDKVARASTQIRSARQDSIFIPPPQLLAPAAEVKHVAILESSRGCYVCKEQFTQVHFFYDALCPTCAAFNYEKRFQSVSLLGKQALITGGRLKIGYQTALMLLRAGASVIVTTRFPRDAAIRFSRESDVGEWSNRLQIYGLDLRQPSSVEYFCAHLVKTLPRLDILINNAAQTVRRPPGFYKHLLDIESSDVQALPVLAREFLSDFGRCVDGLLQGAVNDSTLPSSDARQRLFGLTSSAALSQIPYRGEGIDSSLFPQGKLDADLQQIDLREMNSWRLTLAQVSTAEMLEVHLVNAVAPFILCGKLKSLMMRDQEIAKHIVNVSAIEGQFSRHTKTDKHPHTNMAKAALNMMTLTSARDYVKHNIYMNAVDTGWVTDEDPTTLVARKQVHHDFQPPLDIVDGAARICDPIFSGYRSGEHSWGNFLKDYKPAPW